MEVLKLRGNQGIIVAVGITSKSSKVMNENLKYLTNIREIELES